MVVDFPTLDHAALLHPPTWMQQLSHCSRAFISYAVVKQPELGKLNAAGHALLYRHQPNRMQIISSISSEGFGTMPAVKVEQQS
jgi:hypothetical protein